MHKRHDTRRIISTRPEVQPKEMKENKRVSRCRSNFACTFHSTGTWTGARRQRENRQRVTNLFILSRSNSRWQDGEKGGKKVAPSRPSELKRNCSAYRARISFDRKNGLKVLASLFAQLLSALRLRRGFN